MVLRFRVPGCRLQGRHCWLAAQVAGMHALHQVGWLVDWSGSCLCTQASNRRVHPELLASAALLLAKRRAGSPEAHFHCLVGGKGRWERESLNTCLPGESCRNHGAGHIGQGSDFASRVAQGTLDLDMALCKSSCVSSGNVACLVV